MENEHNRSLIGFDLLRGLAALEVFVGHVRGSSFVEFGALPPSQRTIWLAALFGVTRLGHEAVLVFFVLSGYLIFGQVLRRSIEGRFDLTTYLVDRATRIFLPLIPACIFAAALDNLVFGTALHPGSVVLNIIGLNGVVAQTLRMNAPLWTLAYEIWFYVIGGALGYLSFSRFRSMGALSFIAIGTGVFTVLDAKYLLFWILAGLSILLLNTSYRSAMAVVGVTVAACGTVLIELGSGSKSFTSIVFVPEGMAECFLCLGIIMTVPVLCADETNIILRSLGRPAKALSAISFSLYLFHYPVNSCLDRFFPKAPSIGEQALAFFVLRLLICISVVGIAYFIFERNTSMVRRYFNTIIFRDSPRLLRL